MINHLMYADDMVIISPSVKGLQRLLDICCVWPEAQSACMPSGNCYLNTTVVVGLLNNGIQLAFVRTYTLFGNCDDLRQC